jgi:glycosyltransferase involved in cell wall biosynthesis
VIVAPLPTAEEFRPTGFKAGGLPERYVAMLLDMRTTDPRKRADWLPAIAEEMYRNGIGVVVAGGATQDLDIEGVRGLGRVADDEWAAVLRGARALVYTSSYEGQGMPPLEAIACGTPAVVMDNTALPEVVGEAGVLVAEADAADAPARLAGAALRVASDDVLRAELADRCEAQAARFSQDNFAKRLATAYEWAEARR